MTCELNAPQGGRQEVYFGKSSCFAEVPLEAKHRCGTRSQVCSIRQRNSADKAAPSLFIHTCKNDPPWRTNLSLFRAYVAFHCCLNKARPHDAGGFKKLGIPLSGRVSFLSPKTFLFLKTSCHLDGASMLASCFMSQTVPLLQEML